MEGASAERKRKRLEAWRKRQQQQGKKEEQRKPRGFETTALPSPPVAPLPSSGAAVTISSTPKAKVKLGLGLSDIRGRKKKKRSVVRPGAVFLGEEEKGTVSSHNEDEAVDSGRMQAGLLVAEELSSSPSSLNKKMEGGSEKSSSSLSSKRRRKGRWDVKDDGVTKDVIAAKTFPDSSPEKNVDKAVSDALDTFMLRLESGVIGGQGADGGKTRDKKARESTSSEKRSQQFYIDPSGSMVRMARTSMKGSASAAIVSNVAEKTKTTACHGKSPSTANDWESDEPATPFNIAKGGGNEAEQEMDDEEERGRRAFIEALKKSAPPEGNEKTQMDQVKIDDDDYETKSEVKSEKERREDAVKQLEHEAERVRKTAHAGINTGRIYNDEEGGVMEEAERNLAALTAAPDALEVLAEMNKKKELRAVDHKLVDYLPVRKNLYIVPQSLARLAPAEVAERRARLGIKVRGKGAPAPVSRFNEAGLSERIMGVLEKKGITDPFPVQAQCLPCIMAGRDVIGIAKTGSGKTLAFVLPMIRHILDQPPLGPNETGPIGLILAPARELAYQIHAVCRGLTRHLGLKSTAVYGGAGVAEQIGDLKRGTHILCATPGRLIDILTMQSGKLISLQRVSMVCLDESDRAFDMGFEPQISAILSAVRPDRQTVLFSATFPKAVENLAKKSLRAPLEIIVGGRSVASDSVDQYAEVVEEEDKFLRLLQILGEHADDKKKVIVFAGRQEQADSLFEQLTRCGYSSLSIHGGMDQEDRDSNMSDFKRADGPNVLVATSVAGRGLDVPSCGCVVNYSSPNHLEDYVHRVGRTGRAGNRGVSYTFVNSTDEAKFAPIVVRALTEAGHSMNLSKELQGLSETYKEKVAKGEARWASSGYKGKGYTYDSSEMSDAQKLAQMEKRQALIEAGLLDPEEDEAKDQDKDDIIAGDVSSEGGKAGLAAPGREIGLANVSADVLAIPGMREALMRKAGILPDDDGPSSTGDNHFEEELEINDYPQQARWKVTQKETTSRLQDEFQTAVTLKGQYIESGKNPADGQRKLYLHLEAQSRQTLQTCILEIKRLLNEETLRVGARSSGGGRYSVM